MKIILTTEEDLRQLIEKAVYEALVKQQRGVGEKLYYINHVAKLLGKSHTTIKKATKSGLIRTTKDGLIPESAIEEYLNK